MLNRSEKTLSNLKLKIETLYYRASAKNGRFALMRSQKNEKWRLKMQINIEKLKEHAACSEGLRWFAKNFSRTATVSIDEVIEKLEEQKDSNSYLLWLFEKFELSGLCREWRENGLICKEATYKERELHGFYKEWYKNGQIREEANYKEGKRHGVLKNWYRNGRLYEESNYKDGKLHELCKNWYKNGQLYEESNYKDGELNGLYKMWDENKADRSSNY